MLKSTSDPLPTIIICNYNNLFKNRMRGRSKVAFRGTCKRGVKHAYIPKYAIFIVGVIFSVSLATVYVLFFLMHPCNLQ